MSNNNIRDFRNASAGASGTETNNNLFYGLVVAIPIIAIAAGLGYKPIMELRGKNIAAAQQTQLNMEAKRRAENPLYALKQDMKNSDGLLDPNTVFKSSGTRSSAPKKPRNEYAKRALNAREFLSRVDAKAYGFSALEMETLKYDRATWAMATCGHSDLRKFYVRKNKTSYDRLKGVQDAAKDAQRQTQMAQVDELKIPKIENKTQALAFVASGGVAKHQKNAMSMMSGMSGMLAESEKYEIIRRRQRFNKTGCMQVRTIIQGGSMNVKSKIR